MKLRDMQLKSSDEVRNFLEQLNWASHRASDDTLEELIGKEIRAVVVLIDSIQE